MDLGFEVRQFGPGVCAHNLSRKHGLVLILGSMGHGLSQLLWLDAEGQKQLRPQWGSEQAWPCSNQA